MTPLDRQTWGVNAGTVSAMWMNEIALVLLGLLVLAVLYLLSCIRVLKEYERGVIFRLGRALTQPKGPGLILVFWPVDSLIRGASGW